MDILQPPLAIEDGPLHEPEEGEPDENDDAAASSAAPLASAVDKSAMFSWGPFSFTKRFDQRKKGLAQSWICKCVFHQDASDPAGTDCKRSITFYKAAEADRAIGRLKCWALAGRSVKHRANPKNDSHVGMAWSRVPIHGPAELDKILQDAEAELESGKPWVHHKERAHSRHRGSSSSSSSSPQSSSTSSSSS